MTETRLHYIYDPLCGWCYAVSPLVRTARNTMPVVAHGGGMLAGPLRKQITPELRDHIRSNDLQVTKLTGQPFGEPYLKGLLEDQSVWFDSEPPTAAVLAAEQMGGDGLDMLARLYTAHYVDGLRIGDTSTLLDLATELGLERETFAAALTTAHKHTGRHFSESRELLARVGARGFPTFILEDQGTLQRLDHTPFLGDPLGWKRALELTQAPKLALESAADRAGCTQDGCAL
jgi:putative protein-disulfide isomerase